jgi:drug/metabolite transporter (DMT)-like permease
MVPATRGGAGLGMNETIGALCALGSALSWSVTSLMVSALAPGIGTFTINAARTTLTAMIVIGWMLVAGGLETVLTLSMGSFALLAVSIVLAIAIGDTIFFESAQRIGLGRAMTISMSYPVVAASLAALLLGERLTAPIVTGGLITLAGLVLIVMARAEAPGQPRPWRGVVEALLAALAWGVSVVALRVPLDEIDPVSAQAIRLPVGALILWVTPWALRGAVLLRGGWPLFGRLVVLAAVTAVSSVLYGASVKYAGVAVASVLSSTAPLFAVPLGVLFLGERLPLLALAGTGVTMIGIVVLRL